LRNASEFSAQRLGFDVSESFEDVLAVVSFHWATCSGVTSMRFSSVTEYPYQLS